MVDIAPFKSIHFNPAKVSKISDVICPPYDVIGVPEYHRLLERHANNIVRIELPLAQGKKDRYAGAAVWWKRWQNQKVLAEDKTPAYYGYEQRFTVGTESFTRRGFFAALRLETPGKGHVRPHERTFPKHKEDRLRLMRATHANMSPIFGIFFDRQKKVQTLIAKRMEEKPLALTRDDKGVTHRLWRWDDKEAIKVLSGVLRAEDVLIADGHHRYETAWNYAQERAKQDRSSNTRRRAYRYVMTFLCPLSDPGLVIQPTHRSVRWEAPWAEWEGRMGGSFKFEKMSGLSGVLTKLRNSGESTSIAAVLQGGKLLWLRPKSAADRESSLPVVSLHEKVLKDIPLENISYGQNPKEMVENLQRGEAQAVFLLPPPDKEAFARTCKAGRLMPQKSTYFYPKLATGLVMRSLDGDL
jgi:uncharacterized protein (DUF1015 family)